MNELNELVSIIVPVYKCEKYIKKCILSILQQSYSNIEVIIILDGDYDNSSYICKELAKSDSRIIVIEKENEGVARLQLRKVCKRWQDKLE